MEATILGALTRQIQHLDNVQDLQDLRRGLVFDQSLRTPRGVCVEWDEHPVWEDEINDIDARIENLEAAASVEQES